MSPPSHEEFRALPAPPCAVPEAQPDGSRSDFGAFYRLTLEPLKKYIARFLTDREEARDIAQDAMVKTYRAIGSDTVREPRAFLFTVAKRMAINYKRRRTDRVTPVEESVLEQNAGPGPDLVEEVIARQQAEAFDAALLTLPERCRQVVVMRLNDGLSHGEIAAKLGLSVNTVSNHLTRALRLLREYIPHDPEESTSAH